MNISGASAWPFGVVGVMALGLGLAGCDGATQAGPSGPPPKPSVEVVTLHAEPVTLTTDLPGRTSPFRTAEVRPQVSGVILKRLFVEGDVVQAGQELYQIDPAPYEASLASARASLLHAQASVRTAQSTVDRRRPLTAKNIVSQQDLDNAVGTLQQFQADVASAEAAIKAAKINLAYTKVLSPITGRASRSSVTEGALVTANQTTVLVTVTQLDPIYVDVTQPATTILRLKRELASGQIKSAGNGQAPVKLLLDDGSSYDHAGVLQFSEVTVDQGTGAVIVRAIFPNNEGLLLPGMFVRAQLQEGIRQNGILAPQQGVTHSQKGEPTALIVDAEGKVQSRLLTTDRAIGDAWLITSGLNDGDRLIVSGVQMARPGMQVTVNEAKLSHNSMASAEPLAGAKPAAQ
ncbi:efflux transporter, RND family, MFP subunit [Methylocella silvestris BL2]|uniref:Efflux transporter, RND family, MFP subunit n=1 Tax=Methylocella silvestris (strain DSM 15510 / CIP 108128 / LMG 27833 / NCIMB 13906 / BL2) TaxID=395965 RepID=B8EST3_METSB|nr:efflux RND transporter periplasmic adaptor subunit [Methylocella silvestris]ACK50418.1 efflux transporter, RND family, MFP subunit [Methylocella silvestris BL2]